MTPKSHAESARKALLGIARSLGAKKVTLQDQVVRVTAVGTGFRRHPKVAATMFKTLAQKKINIHMISTSDLRISCVIDRRHPETALRGLHKAFGLGR